MVPQGLWRSQVRDPLLSSFRVVPVLPVLRGPGLQLLPHRLEVTLDKFLKLFPGDAMVVGHGQFPELLQDFVWKAGDMEGQWV